MNWPPETDVSYTGMYAAVMMPKAPSPLFPICCLPSSSSLISVIFFTFFSSEEPKSHKYPSYLPVAHCSQPSLTNLELNYMTHMWHECITALSPVPFCPQHLGWFIGLFFPFFFLRDEHTLQQKHQLLQTN